MTFSLVLIMFGVIAGSLLGSILLGLRFIERGKKCRFADRLGVSHEEPQATTHAISFLREEPKRSLTVRLNTWAMSQVDAAGMKWGSSRVLTTCLLCAILGGLAGVRLSHALPQWAAVFTPIPAMLFAGLPFLYVARRRRQRLKRMEEQLPDALDFLARSLRVGNSFLMALEALIEDAEEPLRSEFQRVTGQIRLGAPVAEPLHTLVRRVPLVDLRMFVSAVLLQRETGGNLGALLTRIAASIRDRFRVRGQVAAAAAQAELSARVIGAMPFVVLGGILFLSPGYFAIMTAEPLGRKLLALAAVGQVLGFLVMRKIVQIKV